MGFDAGGDAMSIVEIQKLRVIERLPGWFGRYFHSEHMTVAHYEFVKGASIHEHHHPQEEVYEVIEGELEITIGGATHVAKPGIAAIVPTNAPHSVRALTDGRAIIVDSPSRPEF
jgi:quercetin dioxygenase-like cupin family protein